MLAAPSRAYQPLPEYLRFPHITLRYSGGILCYLYTLYDTAGRDASEMMELLFWLDEFNPSALHLFLPRKFPGEKCNEVADTSVYYHDNDSWPAHAPVCMWFDYGVLNDFLKEWVVRMDELKSGVITRDEYFEWKINWPYTCDDCGKFEPKKQWRSVKSELSET